MNEDFPYIFRGEKKKQNAKLYESVSLYLGATGS